MRFSILHRIAASTVLSIGLVVAGCNNQSAGAPGAQPAKTASTRTNAPPAEPLPEGLTLATNESQVPSRANPKLQTIKLFVGPHVLKTELALKDEEIRTGMMYRQGIEEDEAMLFVFAFPHRAGFWMKNVDIPLDGAYIDPDGIILEIVDMKPRDETTLSAKTARVQYVLETKHGWFERNSVGPGMLVTTEHGSLKETFSHRPAR